MVSARKIMPGKNIRGNFHYGSAYRQMAGAIFDVLAMGIFKFKGNEG